MPAAKNNGAADRLKAEAYGLAGALADRAMSSVKEQVDGAVGRLTDYVEGDGGPGLMAAVTGAKDLAEGKSPGRAMLGAGWTGLKEKVSGMFGDGKGKGGGKQKLKLTNIVESTEVGVPVRLAYNQWTAYEDFPTFTKKVESARPDENDQQYKIDWKAQVFWSHREWQATIVDQHPDERIVWRSSGQKGHADGAVTFHELAPSLTKIVVAMEYHPQGLFEHTGNLWRAQGRRTRLELKHFQRHVMNHALLNPDDVEGWRGVIEDGRIVKDHETVLREEQEEARQRGEEPAGTVGEAEEDETADAADEDFADEDSEEMPPDEEGEEEEDAQTRPSGDRRRAPAGGGSRGRSPARSRGAARGTR